MARDGVPATALASSTGRPAGRLPQRDFDLGPATTVSPTARRPANQAAPDTASP